MRKLLIVLSALALTLALGACGNGPSRHVTELEARGFTGVVVEDDNAEFADMFASVANMGNCRFRIVWSDEFGYMLVERSSAGEEQDFRLPNPTAPKIRDTSVFDYCEQTEAPAPAPVPGG